MLSRRESFRGFLGMPLFTLGELDGAGAEERVDMALVLEEARNRAYFEGLMTGYDCLERLETPLAFKKRISGGGSAERSSPRLRMGICRRRRGDAEGGKVD